VPHPGRRGRGRPHRDRRLTERPGWHGGSPRRPDEGADPDADGGPGDAEADRHAEADEDAETDRHAEADEDAQTDEDAQADEDAQTDEDAPLTDPLDEWLERVRQRLDPVGRDPSSRRTRDRRDDQCTTTLDHASSELPTCG
jgi:hypothetical protein